jgi:hypothetical protein
MRIAAVALIRFKLNARIHIGKAPLAADGWQWRNGVQSLIMGVFPFAVCLLLKYLNERLILRDKDVCAESRQCLVTKELMLSVRFLGRFREYFHNQTN